MRRLQEQLIDADAEVHKLYEGSAVAPIEAAFPGTTAQGRVDRQKLAQALLAQPEDFARLIERLPVLSPLQVYTSSTRYYPNGSMAAHVLGYKRRYHDATLTDAARAARRKFGGSIRVFIAGAGGAAVVWPAGRYVIELATASGSWTRFIGIELRVTPQPGASPKPSGSTGPSPSGP